MLNVRRHPAGKLGAFPARPRPLSFSATDIVGSFQN
jgi:hypothetical protein